jgi:hypothetical protein
MGTAVACNDDGCPEVLVQQSHTALPVSQNQGYKIRVGGYTARVRGDCGVEHDTPGCQDPTCEAAVCAVDASCCNSSFWHGYCTELAMELCGGRTGVGTILLELTAPPPEDFDLADYAAFTRCATALCQEPRCDPPLYLDACCLTSDFDGDGDVDLLDYAAFLPALAGP